MRRASIDVADRDSRNHPREVMSKTINVPTNAAKNDQKFEMRNGSPILTSRNLHSMQSMRTPMQK